MSVSFTDGTEEIDPEEYLQYESEAGRVYVPKKGVLIDGPIGIRYEKRPWIEQFELDGIKPAPIKREGFGVKSVQGFLLSLATVYDGAGTDYLAYKGDGKDDVEGFLVRTTDRMISESASDPKQFSRFSGFVENMWRIGNEHAYHLAMDEIIPLIRANEEACRIFLDKITDEFREALAA